MKDFDDFLNASGDEEDEQLEKTTPARRGGSPSYRGGEGGGGGLSFGSSKLNLQNTWFSQARPQPLLLWWDGVRFLGLISPWEREPEPFR